MTMPFSPYQLAPDLMRSLQISGQPAAPEKLSLWDKIQNAVAPVPSGVGGLLGEQDIKNARNQGLLQAGLAAMAASGPTTQHTNLGQILAQGGQAGVQGYQGAIQGQIDNRMKGLDFKSKQAQMDAFKQKQADMARISAARDATFKKYGPPPSGDENAMGAWIDKVAPELMAAGDDISQLVDYRKALREKQDANKPQQVQAGDMATTFVPGKGFWDPNADNGAGGKGAFVPSIERHMSPDEMQMKRLALGEQQARTNAMQDIANQSHYTALTKNFASENKSLVERAAPINQALLSVRAAQGDPSLTKIALGAMLQAADQKAQLRSQILQYYSNLDPSIAGHWETLKSKLLDGKLPLYQSQAVVTHLSNLLDQVHGMYARRRAGEVGRHPKLDEWLPQADEFFNQEDGMLPGQKQYDMSQYNFGGGQ
jgi:hypothetical protein